VRVTSGVPLTHPDAMKSLAPLTAIEVRWLQRALLAWFREHQRELPWRKNRNPYCVWVSEVMLQQTQVATVIPYFERWMKRYPTVRALASAKEPEVLKAWEGLGYYSRARNLRRGADHVVTAHAGQLPDDVTALRRIPGIGRYTAGAIASIAFEKPEPILDGNIMRVLCRVRDLDSDPRKAPLHEHLWVLARQLATHTDSRSMNESLMELGALVCTPKNPQCALCPLRHKCLALEHGTIEKRPHLAPGPGSTQRRVQILLVTRGREHVLLHRRDASSKPWANLWTLPYLECDPAQVPLAHVRSWANEHLGAAPQVVRRVANGKYSVTRYRFTYEVFAFSAQAKTKARLPAGCSWVQRSQVGQLAMPAPHRRLWDAHTSDHP